MAECESYHELCRAKAQDGKSLEGIRFLRIGNNSIFLEEAVPAQYACLSHVWGSVQDLLKTTQENRTTHMTQGILVKDLPKTYQDAITVCRELGINHLWIDSLCIIQNSSEDWNEQASRMAEVYSNAYITIAAVRARNSQEGLFNTVSDRLGSFPLPGYPWIHIRRYLQLPSEGDDFMDLDTNDGHTLYKRGWTFQELSLPPRVIHYGRNEVIWHCQSRSSCESDPEGIVQIPSLVSADLIKEPDFAMRDFWCLIVEAYSWRSLTFDKDRLPAIAAFASRLQEEEPQRRYVHGLWEDSLGMDLLWYVEAWREDHHSEPSSGFEPRRLPTWSWTSVDSPVTWTYISNPTQFEEIPYTKIKKVVYDTRGPPILGDAIEAHIVIQAPVLKLSDIRMVEKWKEMSLGDPNEVVWHSPHWDTLTDAVKYGNQSTEALAIPMIMMKEETIGTYSGRYTNSLVIVETSEIGKFMRVGVATIGPLTDLAHATSWSLQSSEYEEQKEISQRRRRSQERFMQMMEQMDKRTITLI